MLARSPVAVLAVAAVLLGGTATAHKGEPDSPGTVDPWAPLVPAIVEYHWHLLVPEWTVETRIDRRRVYAPRWGAARLDFALPDIRTERRRIGAVPEFSCKYPDFRLPNECRTTWRDVYVDVPRPVLQRDHVDVDVPRWTWRDQDTPIDVPRLVWREETLIVSLPALRAGARRFETTRRP